MDNKLDTIPKRVAHAINESDRSPTDIAFRMGVGEGTIWRWNKLDKSNFKEREVHKLAKIIGYNPDWILYADEPKLANDQLNRIKSVRDDLGVDYKGRDQTIAKVARRLRSIGQELVLLADDLDGVTDQ